MLLWCVWPIVALDKPQGEQPDLWWPFPWCSESLRWVNKPLFLWLSFTKSSYLSEIYSWFLSVQWTQETLNGMYQYFIKVCLYTAISTFCYVGMIVDLIGVSVSLTLDCRLYLLSTQMLEAMLFSQTRLGNYLSDQSLSLGCNLSLNCSDFCSYII